MKSGKGGARIPGPGKTMGRPKGSTKSASEKMAAKQVCMARPLWDRLDAHVAANSLKSRSDLISRLVEEYLNSQE